jgi:hypothetical protein
VQADGTWGFNECVADVPSFSLKNKVASGCMMLHLMMPKGRSFQPSQLPHQQFDHHMILLRKKMSTIQELDKSSS